MVMFAMRLGLVFYFSENVNGRTLILYHSHPPPSLRQKNVARGN